MLQNLHRETHKKTHKSIQYAGWVYQFEFTVCLLDKHKKCLPRTKIENFFVPWAVNDICKFFFRPRDGSSASDLKTGKAQESVAIEMTLVVNFLTGHGDIVGEQPI